MNATPRGVTSLHARFWLGVALPTLALVCFVAWVVTILGRGRRVRASRCAVRRRRRRSDRGVGELLGAVRALAASSGSLRRWADRACVSRSRVVSQCQREWGRPVRRVDDGALVLADGHSHGKSRCRRLGRSFNAAGSFAVRVRDPMRCHTLFAWRANRPTAAQAPHSTAAFKPNPTSTPPQSARGFGPRPRSTQSLQGRLSRSSHTARNFDRAGANRIMPTTTSVAIKHTPR